MKPSKTLAALAVVLGTSAIVAPLALSAQETAPDDPAATEAPMGDMTGGGMGHGMAGGGTMFDFAAVDADGDGRITEAELQAWRAAQIAGLDADGNGLISEAELTAQITARMAERAAKMAKARIAAHDADGDGSLSAAELAAPPLPMRLFDRVDADGDGAITQAELDAARERMQEHRGDGHGRGGRMRHGGWFGGGDN